MSDNNNTTGISLFFPVYNDERTVRKVCEKSLQVLAELSDVYELIIINDCSPDGAGAIADEVARENPGKVRVIHHERTLGYGMALRSGFDAAQYEWICFTDGDDEYDVFDFKKLFKLKDFYDLIITFRYVRLYSSSRVLISSIYNMCLRFLFRSPYRDISTGLRMVRKSLIRELPLESVSSFIGAELTIKTMLKGYRVGEVGIQTFPREFGTGSSTSIKNIILTIREMLKIHRKIFSENYDLPEGRGR
ncbi:MAG TPA: glycosyltransferase family 2 protein [Pseudomonadales bacterium]|nr:glycosyltransferase family 2 protein [Pseudomonadales bacterium]